MSSEIAPLGYDEAFALAERVGSSALIPPAYRNKPADACLAIIYGAEMGLPPLTALQRIVVVNGRPTLDAQGIVNRVRAAGHSIQGDVDSTRAIVRGRRADNGDEMTVTFTIEDAQRAGLLKNDVYKKHPDDMLWARAVSRLGRRLFSDLIGGVSYTPDEARDIPVRDDDALAPAAPVRRRRPPPGAPPPAADPATGEVIDAEGWEEPEPEETNALDEMLHALGQLVAETEPEEEREALRHHLRERFGDPRSCTRAQLQDATTVAAGWPATDPTRQTEDF